MLKTFRASKSNIVVWILLVFLIIGLGGFGISTVGGGGQSVARVGDTQVEADAYARALDQELRGISNQLGRQLPMSEAQQYGIDRNVLRRLVDDAALDEEAARLGLSAGDEAVQQLVVATPAFQGVDGRFDRQAYAFALERAGLTPAAFEAMVRAEAAREIIAGSLQSAVEMPATAAETLLGFAAEQRRFDWIALDPGLLPEPAGEPDAAALDAFYAENQDRYMRPETRRITYALLDPAVMAETIEVPEEELRAAYEAASDRYDVPERRVLDRIGFATTEEAQAALARIEGGEIDFDALAAERGLDEATMDQGEVTEDALEPDAAAAVFGAEGPGVVGPADTPLGPSLFRINAVLAASQTPFEEARDELRAERALIDARAQALDAAQPVADMIAGGARIEEIVADSAFEQGTIELSEETTGGLADDPAFREAALAAEVAVESDLVELESGGMAALRVEAVDAPAPIPLDEIRSRVVADWRSEENGRRLEALAADMAVELDEGLAIADLAARLGRPLQAAGPMARGEIIPTAPAGLVEAVFAADEAGAAVIEADAGRVALAQLVEIVPFDPAEPASAELAANVGAQLNQQAADDALALTVQALQAQAGLTVNQAMVDQVIAQFP